MPESLDVTRAPRGEIAAAELVRAVAKVGDMAERHYLELKGPMDLRSKADKQKIAKFILGAANRLSETAAEAFEGCAVMILGLTERGIEGLPPIEMLELSKVVQPFLGIPGPRWDIFRVPAEGSDRQVLVVVVEPPTAGQPLYICRSSGDGLTDGRVYLRADGETREANSAEQDAMRERSSALSPGPVELEVSVSGKVMQITVDTERTLEAYLQTTRSELLNALHVAQARTPPSGDPQNGMLSTVVEAFTNPEGRTATEYLHQIDQWEEDLRAGWAEAMTWIPGYFCEGNEIVVQNRTQTFLHDVEVNLHLEGTVDSIDLRDMPDHASAMDLQLPGPPRKWGPTSRFLFGDTYMPPMNLYARGGGPSTFRPPSSTWKNSGSVDVDVVVGDLRPETTFVTDDGASGLIILGEAPDCIQGTWRGTVRGYNQVFKGTCEMEAIERHDLTDWVRELLGLEQ
jgi:hypothetical protein